ncbi:single-stranded DNA-binding protein [Salinibacterium sp. G-O1]|uniref:single-stranded DNA-binding protein n=1 Tax=Salinibacterium sp. G-O1 TaxID=3046208 RepID=UPI0024B8B261|nr:single-stranded DNA-binding protein [Salinibacterium sp. G-O1]MDJ0336554.1 single-stranded DNA-binding protein [Salinibacterium sp. G-O1]
MTDTITLTGLVATTPRKITTSEGLDIASFRLASTTRRYDRGTSRWVDGDTNWYTITAFRGLACNTAESIDKGQRVIVTGALRIREWENGERTGTSIEVEADAIGHNLTFGTTQFTRTPAPVTSEPEPAAEETGMEETGVEEADIAELRAKLAGE